MRRELDFYPTPAWATEVLCERANIEGVVLEPCVGRHDIANVLAMKPDVFQLRTNDLDTTRKADRHGDATDPLFWRSYDALSWVITNPPFTVAHKILPLAFEATRGRVAMLLRLTYLEPCEGRADWLVAHPPNKLIVLPRISFTGDGKTDSVTCAWFVWDRYCCGQSIEVVPPRADAVKLPLTA